MAPSGASKELLVHLLSNLQKVLDDVSTKLDNLEAEEPRPPKDLNSRVPPYHRKVLSDPARSPRNGYFEVPAGYSSTPLNSESTLQSGDHPDYLFLADSHTDIASRTQILNNAYTTTKLEDEETRGVQSGDVRVADSNRVAEAWEKVWKRLRNLDEAKIKDYKEDIDTLLVFAGLFSAVVTAFLVAFYVSLQPDTKDVAAFLLHQISMQLSTTFPVNGTMYTAGQFNIPPMPFRVSSSVVAINILWFTSLIFALVTASGGILVKQWLREFMAIGDMSPDQRCRVRYIREMHLKRWRVYEIASFLPLLLQTSVVLFFVGLCNFVQSINDALGWAITALVIIYFVLFGTVTFIAPLISVYCPYKTPFLSTFLQAPRYYWWRLRYNLHNKWIRAHGRLNDEIQLAEQVEKVEMTTKLMAKCSFLEMPEPFPDVGADLFSKYNHYGVSALEMLPRDNHLLNIPVIVAADAALLNPGMQGTYELCLSGTTWEELAKCGKFPLATIPYNTYCLDSPQKVEAFLEVPMSGARVAVAEKIIQWSYGQGGTIPAEIAAELTTIAKRTMLYHPSPGGQSRRPRRYLDEVSASTFRTLAESSVDNALEVIKYLLACSTHYKLEVTSMSFEWCNSPSAVTKLVEAGTGHIMSSSNWVGVATAAILCCAIMQLPPSRRMGPARRFLKVEDIMVRHLRSGAFLPIVQDSEDFLRESIRYFKLLVVQATKPV